MQNLCNELASRITGREYGDELTPADHKFAKDNNLVVVYGYSDDLVELEGAINDEVGAGECDGTAFSIARVKNRLMLISDEEDDEVGAVIENLREHGWTVTPSNHGDTIRFMATWCHNDHDVSWYIESNAEFSAPFEIMEDQGVFCRGLVVGFPKP